MGKKNERNRLLDELRYTGSILRYSQLMYELNLYEKYWFSRLESNQTPIEILRNISFADKTIAAIQLPSYMSGIQWAQSPRNKGFQQQKQICEYIAGITPQLLDRYGSDEKKFQIALCVSIAKIMGPYPYQDEQKKRFQAGLNIKITPPRNDFFYDIYLAICAYINPNNQDIREKILDRKSEGFPLASQVARSIADAPEELPIPNKEPKQDSVIKNVSSIFFNSFRKNVPAPNQCNQGPDDLENHESDSYDF